MINRQDLNGYRKPEDVARRFKLGDIELNTEDIEALKKTTTIDNALSLTSEHAVENKIITGALNNLNNGKVDKVTGKGLSTNDYDDSEKLKVSDAYNLKHWHDNLATLDTITTAKIQAWDSSSSVWYVLTETGSTNYITLPSASSEFMIVVDGSLNMYHLGHYPKGLFLSPTGSTKEIKQSYTGQYDSSVVKATVARTQSNDIRVQLDKVEEDGTDITSTSKIYVYYK